MARSAQLEVTLTVADTLAAGSEMEGVLGGAARDWLEGLVDDLLGSGILPQPWPELARERLRRSPASFAVRLVDDEEMTTLNQRFRNRQCTTDVLSFPGEDSAEGFHLGDVAISLPVAERQSSEHAIALAEELQRLMLHGVLHCLGFDHETDRGEMERVERDLRQRWVHSASPWALRPAYALVDAP